MRLLTIALSVLVGLVAPALAQGPALETEGDDLVLSAATQQLRLPRPEWLSPDAQSTQAIREQAFVRLIDGEAETRLEIYPRGEGEAFWNTLYGAQITRAADPDLPAVRALVIDLYAATCRPETVALFQLEPDGADTIPPLGLVCGRYRDITGVGDMGEVMVVGFLKTEQGAAMVFQQWRGEAFDASNPAAWPVSTDEIEARIAQFKAEPVFASLD